MITLNNVKFAENEKEYTDSLFKLGGTCNGYYKRLKRKVKLYDRQKNLIGVINAYGVLLKATKRQDGRYCYSFGEVVGVYSFYHESMDINNIIKYRMQEKCYFK